MILLNKEHPYDFPAEYENVTDKLERFYVVLKTLNKEFMGEIISCLKSKKIIVVYAKPNESTDIRTIVPHGKLNKEGKITDVTKVYVNISDLTANIDNAVLKNNLDISKLYSYLLQAYGMLSWGDKIRNRRDIIDSALETYSAMMMYAITSKGIGYFRNDNEKAILKFILYMYVLYKTDTIVSDPVPYAMTRSGLSEAEAVRIHENYREYFEDSISLDSLLYNVLMSEFPFSKKIDKTSYLVLTVFKFYGPLGALMIDDLSFFVPMALDFTQSAKPITYNKYPNLIKDVKKSDYVYIVEALKE